MTTEIVTLSGSWKRGVVIGDIHGCISELKSILRKVNFSNKVTQNDPAILSDNHNPSILRHEKRYDSRESTDDLCIFVGDIVNKGPDSYGCVRLLRALGAVGVVGNHDLKLLTIIKAMHSNDATVDTTSSLYKLAVDCPNDIIEYLNSLPHVIRIPQWHVIVVHAGLDPSLPLARQNVEAMTRMRRLQLKTETSETAPLSSSEFLNAFERGKSGDKWFKVWKNVVQQKNGDYKKIPLGEQFYSTDIVVYGHDAKSRITKPPVHEPDLGKPRADDKIFDFLFYLSLTNIYADDNLRTISIQLSADGELCILVPFDESGWSSSVTVQNVANSNEKKQLVPKVDVLGSPLVPGVKYYLLPGQNFSLYSWTPSTIEVHGSLKLLHNMFKMPVKSVTRPLVEYHCGLDQLRRVLHKRGETGPVVLVCGSTSSGKAQIGRTLCSYAARSDWKPLLVDLDCGVSQMIGVPGTIGAAITEYPVTIDEVISQTHVCFSFFTGFLECQSVRDGEATMGASYRHYSFMLLDVMRDRLNSHLGTTYSSSGAVIVLPEVVGVSGANFVFDVVEKYAISHILCCGDDYLFHKLYSRFVEDVDVNHAHTRVDKISQSYFTPAPVPTQLLLPTLFENFFNGQGPIRILSALLLRPFDKVEVFQIKEDSTSSMPTLTSVEREELQGKVGCMTALYPSNHSQSLLSASPLTIAKIDAVDARGAFVRSRWIDSLAFQIKILSMTGITVTEMTCYHSDMTIGEISMSTSSVWHLWVPPSFVVPCLPQFLAPQVLRANSAKKDLEKLLDVFCQQGEKSLALFAQDSVLVGLILLADLPALAESRPSIKGIFSLEKGGAPNVPVDRALYIFNPVAINFNSMLLNFQSLKQKFPRVSPGFVCVPEKTMMAEQILEEDFELNERAPGMEITSLDIDILHIDSPVLSMNIPESFRKIICDEDMFTMRWIARLLIKAQTSYLGPFPAVVSVGPIAARVAAMMTSMQQDVRDMLTNRDPLADKVYLVDRSVDLATPLLTQQTYEGLIDELFGFDCCQATFPFPVDDSGSQYMCGLNDKLFSELRGVQFSKIGSLLSEKLLDVKQKYDKRKELYERNIKEIREFVENLSELQETGRLTEVHASIARNVGKLSQKPTFRKRVLMEQYILQQTNDREVFDYIEELICRRSNLLLIMRLLCLYSVVRGGLKPRDYDTFKEKMMLSFGVCETLSAFLTLSKSGLLSQHKGRSSEYAQWARGGMGSTSSELKTTGESINQLYGDYAPPLVVLLEGHLKARAGNRHALNTTLHALSADVRQTVLPVPETRNVRSNPLIPATTVMLVMGGLTTTEANGMRLLQRKYPEFPFIVYTTDITSGNRIMDHSIWMFTKTISYLFFHQEENKNQIVHDSRFLVPVLVPPPFFREAVSRPKKALDLDI
eukprot:gene9248-6501_t